MAQVPVFCDNCGTLFTTTALVGDGEWSFSGVGYGPCPVCQGTGRVLDGAYDFVGDTIRVVSAPAWSQEKLGWLQARVEAAQKGLVSAETVLDEAAAESPALGDEIEKYLAKGWTAIQILVTLLAILQFAQQQLNPPVTQQDLDKTRDAIIRELPRVPGTTSAPPPSRSSSPKPAKPKRAPKTHGKSKTRKPRKRR